jgi:hypothetical protein
MVDWVIRCALKGLPVFPLYEALPDGSCACGNPKCGRDTGKHPRVSGGFKSATTDEAQIKSWWEKWPTANIGIATGAVSDRFVLDEDPRHGGDESLRRLEAEHGPLPRTLTARTGGGGRHFYFSGAGYPSTTGRIARGLDVKCEGGYIAAPPSTHESGRAYEWIDESPVAPLPDWLGLLARKAAKAKAMSGPGQTVHRVGRSREMTDPIVSAAAGQLVLADEGTRNSTAYEEALRVGRALRHTPDAMEGARAALVKAATRAGLTSEEAEEAVENGLRNGAAAREAPEGDRGMAAPPDLAEAALWGLAGDYVTFVTPYTEAHSAGVLLTFLSAYGAAVGRGPHFKVSATRHGTNENVILVGSTSRGRKGMAVDAGLRPFKLLGEPSHPPKASGLTSGEGLIWAVRDPIFEMRPVTDKNKVVIGHNRTLKDPGIEDKRLLVIESEMGGPFKAMSRDKNILSSVIRSAWDGESLQTLAKNAPAKATEPHISIIGSITPDELRRQLSTGETLNGFVNRFLFAVVESNRDLPHGDPPPDEGEKQVAEKLRTAIEFGRQVGEVRRDATARALWEEFYPALNRSVPGLAGAATARAHAHVSRLSMIYALLDLSQVVTEEHLVAALAMWDYCMNSALALFGRHGDLPLAERIFMLLVERPSGMTRTEIHDAFHGNVNSAAITEALASLEKTNRAVMSQEESGGRPTERWSAVRVEAS